MTEAATSPVTVTVRLIRSFQHRNIRNLVIHDVDVTTTVSDFMELVRGRLKTAPALPPPFRNFAYDTFKIETQAFGFKTNDPVINREDDETLILQPGKSLGESGVKNETEISFFKLDDYLQYKQNPVHALSWRFFLYDKRREGFYLGLWLPQYMFWNRNFWLIRFWSAYFISVCHIMIRG